MFNQIWLLSVAILSNYANSNKIQTYRPESKAKTKTLNQKSWVKIIERVDDGTRNQNRTYFKPNNFYYNSNSNINMTSL